uniref:Uncharacterized protein n=1 Tax=Anguilla anguilla TaxID=7936 RepID=A0A0E9RHC6_ANGAN
MGYKNEKLGLKLKTPFGHFHKHLCIYSEPDNSPFLIIFKNV